MQKKKIQILAKHRLEHNDKRELKTIDHFPPSKKNEKCIKINNTDSLSPTSIKQSICSADNRVCNLYIYLYISHA